MKSKVLINASNLHNGGGVQVASSFIKELTLLDFSELDISVFVSSEIYWNLKDIGVNFDHFKFVAVFDTFGLAAFFSKLNKYTSSYDLIFTIFGPNYLRKGRYVNVVGFAQAWILDNSAYKVLSPAKKLRAKFKFFFQKMIFKKSDAFVVELEHVREGLYRERIANVGKAYVAHNCISSVYLEKHHWQSFEIKAPVGCFRIGFLGRDYPHKNTKIIPQVKKLLFQVYGLDVEFFVTFSESEWNAKSNKFKRSVNNVGSLSITQCPYFYLAMDGIIFPSILECFSATPIEAMAMERPLFASDRGFVRDVCSDYAFYFDPWDPEDAAKVIADYIRNQSGKDSLRLAQGRRHAINFSNPRARAEQYLQVIRNELSESLKSN